ncbi:MAG TPA: UpxY family transcription antiterminator [Candidatus Polarisedimenticolia bacterium]|jgi:transcriptional antiterminator NusG|nr:UpxY family transcription antiterminator [Candidatus Polarisedimenticolia bacterium]
MSKVRSATHLPEQFHEECWYAVYTRTRHEKCVAEHCTQRGITAFLPLYNVQRRWKQRRAEVFLPLFPSYIFVHIALRDRVRILGLPGIVSLVSFNNVPAVVPESQIESLKRAIVLGKAEPHIYLHSGRRVRVTNGPLIGLEGIVVEIKNRVQVIVSFEWMARSVAISLDATDVETLQ